jgi:hypothetical protein
MEMNRYTAVLTRISVERADVTIEAESLDEACSQVLALNPELDWYRVATDDQAEVESVALEAEGEDNAA